MIRCRLCGRWGSRSPDNEVLEKHLILEGYEIPKQEVAEYFEEILI